ncbi:DoxX family protein [Granulicella sp. WH15]|uniref:DoxX family protein n=1 Tax=Granulicella sp. WH15 TaxID=2602070 RepID=UPI0013669E18|nr:DoxX family protein [Granulicella sp. WH15]QHN03897.1 DoxX family protein [Granulicella sp. WH15]
MVRWLNGFQPWGVFLLRVVLGAAMVSHSWSKVYPAGGLNHGHLLSSVEHFNDYVVHLGLPRWLGYVSTATEFVGGFSILIGLFTRFWSLLTAGDLLVALVLVNLRHGYEASEHTLTLAAIAVMLLLAGPGAASLDRRLGLH